MKFIHLLPVLALFLAGQARDILNNSAAQVLHG